NLSKYLGILLLMFSVITHAQNKPAGEAEARLAFEHDLKADQLKIYVLGGIVPAITKKDLEVAKDHDFSYHDFGCTAPMNFDYYTFYNKFVFDLLLTQHGEAIAEKLNPQSFGYRDIVVAQRKK